jgi:hypothetical protein
MLDKPGDEKAQRSVYDSGGILFKLFGDGDHRTQLSGRADAQAEYSIFSYVKASFTSAPAQPPYSSTPGATYMLGGVGSRLHPSVFFDGNRLMSRCPLTARCRRRFPGPNEKVPCASARRGGATYASRQEEPVHFRARGLDNTYPSQASFRPQCKSPVPNGSVTAPRNRALLLLVAAPCSRAR